MSFLVCTGGSAISGVQVRGRASPALNTGASFLGGSAMSAIQIRGRASPASEVLNIDDDAPRGRGGAVSALNADVVMVTEPSYHIMCRRVVSSGMVTQACIWRKYRHNR